MLGSEPFVRQVAKRLPPSTRQRMRRGWVLPMVDRMSAVCWAEAASGADPLAGPHSRARRWERSAIARSPVAEQPAPTIRARDHQDPADGSLALSAFLA